MKPIELFEAGDFELNDGSDVSRVWQNLSAATIANEKLNSWLKSAVRVYGDALPSGKTKDPANE